MSDEILYKLVSLLVGVTCGKLAMVALILAMVAVILHGGKLIAKLPMGAPVKAPAKPRRRQP